MKSSLLSVLAMLLASVQAGAQTKADVFDYFCIGANQYPLETDFHLHKIADQVDAKFTEQIQLLRKAGVPASAVAELVEIKATITTLPWGKKRNGVDWAVAEKQVWKECERRLSDFNDPLFDWMDTRKGAEYYFTIGYVAMKSAILADTLLDVDEGDVRDAVLDVLSGRILNCGDELNYILKEASMAEVRNKTSIAAAQELLKIINVASKLKGEKPKGLVEADIVELRGAGRALQDLAKKNQLVDPNAKPGRTLNIAPADF